MIIEKNGKKYIVSEYSTKWVIKSNNGKLSVAYDVSKELCPSEDKLKEYINKCDLF